MKKQAIINLITVSMILFTSLFTSAQNPENWTSKQLAQPSELANAITAKQELPVIISVGPGAVIPNSIVIGMVNSKEGLDKLKQQLAKISKDKKIILYCGCCPFEHCPNVRPATDALNAMKFTNFYILNLPHNIKQDWIDKGYPVTK